MKDSSIEAQYDISKKHRLQKFYENNKIFVYSILCLLIFLLISTNFYLSRMESKRVLLADNFVQSKILLEKGEKVESLKLLKENVYANDKTYSILSFYLIVNQKLITDHLELIKIFDHILNNNKFDKEIKNLLIYKKLLIAINFSDELFFLKAANPILNSDNYWKPHALLLLGNYYFSRNEFLKAKDFYSQILLINNLNNYLYDEAKLQLSFVNNE
jgi:tetratricopeptide (TPR) repeat protein